MSLLYEYHIGLDLGQSVDYSAIAIIEKRTLIDYRHRTVSDESEFSLVGLKRFVLKTPYPQIVREIAERLSVPPFDDGEPIFLVCDKTGVGQGIFDLILENDFLSNRCDLIGVQITGGHSVSGQGSVRNVPKRDLVFLLAIELQKGNLKIASQIPEAKILVSEMQDFELRFTPKANDTYGAINGQHDDLVIASALGLWSAKNFDGDIDPTGILRNAMKAFRTRRRR